MLTRYTAARGRAGLPPPGRRLVFCLYLVYLVYLCMYLDIFEYILVFFFGDVTVFFLLEICTKINDPRPYLDTRTILSEYIKVRDTHHSQLCVRTDTAVRSENICYLLYFHTLTCYTI